MKQLLIICLAIAQQATAQLYVQTGATISTNGNATICLQNADLICNGTINQAAGTGRFVYNGTANTVISGSSMPNFAALEMNKTSGATLNLQQHIGINETIKFNNGIIQLNNYNILLQPTATLDGENETSRITGTTGGYVEITNTLNAPMAVNMGNLGATITTTQSMGSTTIRRGHTSQTGIGGVGSSIHRYFEITPTNNTALNATLNFNYFDAELNSQMESSLVQYKSNDNINWTNMGFNTRDAAANYVEKTGLADFSRWTLSNFNNVLPIALTNFSVACNSGNKLILWQTEQEVNTARFDVQTSTNGVSWSTIATLPAAGISNTTKAYQYTYTNAPNTALYYRIVAVDIIGKQSYTPTIKSLCGGTYGEVKVYPNPVANTLWLSINSVTTSNVLINIIDQKGVIVLTQKISIVNGANLLPIQVANLPSALYNVQINYANGQPQQTIKIVKN